jgi:hypothetical protein
VDYEFIKQHPNRAIGHRPHEHIEKTRLEIPMLGAGGVYTSANDLAKFVQFHLNLGQVGGRQILDANLMNEMYNLPPLGVFMGIYMGNPDNPTGIDGTRNWGHDGGGFGFQSVMLWLPDYDIGVLALTNSSNHDNRHGKATYGITNGLVLKNLVEKKDSNINSQSEALKAYNQRYSEYKRPDTDSFTPYQPEWKKYKGKYKYLNDINFYTYAKIALALGYYHPELNAKVYEKNGFLEIDGKRLDEYQPGVFFTADGDCLDFSGPVPLWKGMRIKKK